MPLGWVRQLGVAAATVSVTCVSGNSQLFVGGAGCDASDGHCARDTPEGTRAIWSFSLTDDGELEALSKYSVPGVPAWLLSAPQLPHCLFATLADVSTLLAFELSGRTLRPAASVKSGGMNPVFASVSEDGSVLLVANYHGPDDVTSSDGASVASFRIGPQCDLTLAAVVPMNGSSVVHGRQDSAHPHSFLVGRGGLGYACDLGQDAVFSIAVGPTGELRVLHRNVAQLGDGPRHLVQHPSSNVLYVVNELGCTVTAYREEGGVMTALRSYSTLPAGASRNGTKAAEIAITPDGATVLATNRGLHNTVCVFAVLPGGELKVAGQLDAPAFPRGMLLTSRGRVLVVAGQHDGVVSTYRLGVDGMFSPTGVSVLGPPTAAALAAVVTRSPAEYF